MLSGYKGRAGNDGPGADWVLWLILTTPAPLASQMSVLQSPPPAMGTLDSFPCVVTSWTVTRWNSSSSWTAEFTCTSLPFSSTKYNFRFIVELPQSLNRLKVVERKRAFSLGQRLLQSCSLSLSPTYLKTLSCVSEPRSLVYNTYKYATTTTTLLSAVHWSSCIQESAMFTTWVRQPWLLPGSVRP